MDEKLIPFFLKYPTYSHQIHYDWHVTFGGSSQCNRHFVNSDFDLIIYLLNIVSVCDSDVPFQTMNA